MPYADREQAREYQRDYRKKNLAEHEERNAKYWKKRNEENTDFENRRKAEYDRLNAEKKRERNRRYYAKKKAERS